jgi:ATP-dependent DNA helicase RecQ
VKKMRLGKKALRQAAAAALPTAERDLFERLRARRFELARAQNVPPYVIFHDKTLSEMAARRPRSPSELADIPGVGEAKLARYGKAFLEVINGSAS